MDELNEQEIKQMELRNRKLYLTMESKFTNLCINIIDSIENRFIKKEPQLQPINFKNGEINYGNTTK